MQKFKQFAVGLLVIAASESIYLVIQRVAPGRYDFGTALDSWLPFWPSWIWIYLSIAPTFLAAAAFLSKADFQTTLKRVCVAQLITFPIFLIFPSDFPRTNTLDPDSFYGWGYGLMRSIDQANNTFPSLHVSQTWIIAHMSGRTLLPPWVAYGYAILITFSTFVTKQHFVWDAIGGIMVFLLTLKIVRSESH